MAEDGQAEIEALWTGTDQVAPLAANQFLLQHAGDEEIVLTVGHVTPPIFRGTTEERIAQARRTPTVPIHVLGRYSMTRARLVELRELLDEYLSIEAR